MSAIQPKIYYVDRDHVTGAVANVLVSFSVAEPSRPYLDNWGTSSKELVATYGQIVAMNIIDSDAKPPSDAARVEINRLITTLSDKIVAIAIVPEGSGFLAAAKRSALSMITLMSRRPFPIRVFGDVAEASNWLISQLRSSSIPARLDMSTLATAAESIRNVRRSSDQFDAPHV
ncbi:MAG TPA: hypothetical protein VM686_42040 [Polyangiaceae bacterium]|nr:hypothetical protein [Polyangiaceae bacterium]